MVHTLDGSAISVGGTLATVFMRAFWIKIRWLNVVFQTNIVDDAVIRQGVDDRTIRMWDVCRCDRDNFDASEPGWCVVLVPVTRQKQRKKSFSQITFNGPGSQDFAAGQIITKNSR